MAARVDAAQHLHATHEPSAKRSRLSAGSEPADLTERARDRILSAALEEFANRGYDGTTTAEIARHAGVTQPLVHYHFETKDALWRAAVGGAFEQAVGSFEGVVNELADLELI